MCMCVSRERERERERGGRERERGLKIRNAVSLANRSNGYPWFSSKCKEIDVSTIFMFT